MANERNLVAVSIKHTEWRWKFGMPCILWGHRTKDDEKRSFGGYTQFPNNAEVYSLEDWANSGYAKCEWISHRRHAGGLQQDAHLRDLEGLLRSVPGDDRGR